LEGGYLNFNETNFFGHPEWVRFSKNWQTIELSAAEKAMRPWSDENPTRLIKTTDAWDKAMIQLANRTINLLAASPATQLYLDPEQENPRLRTWEHDLCLFLPSHGVIFWAFQSPVPRQEYQISRDSR